MFSPRQPIPASSRLAAAVQLRAVQPADRRAAQVPPPSPLRDGGQQGSGKGPGGRTPSRSGLLNRCILTFVSCDIFRQSCITLWHLITLLHVSTSCEIPPSLDCHVYLEGKQSSRLQENFFATSPIYLVTPLRGPNHMLRTTELDCLVSCDD